MYWNEFRYVFECIIIRCKNKMGWMLWIIGERYWFVRLLRIIVMGIIDGIIEYLWGCSVGVVWVL